MDTFRYACLRWIFVYCKSASSSQYIFHDIDVFGFGCVSTWNLFTTSAGWSNSNFKLKVIDQKRHKTQSDTNTDIKKLESSSLSIAIQKFFKCYVQNCTNCEFHQERNIRGRSFSRVLREYFLGGTSLLSSFFDGIKNYRKIFGRYENIFKMF